MPKAARRYHVLTADRKGRHSDATVSAIADAVHSEVNDARSVKRDLVSHDKLLLVRFEGTTLSEWSIGGGFDTNGPTDVGFVERRQNTKGPPNRYEIRQAG